MNCEHYQLELEDLLDGELDAPRANEVRAHLAGCSACRAREKELEYESEIFASYHAQTALEPTPEMWLAIRDRMCEEPISSSAQKAAWLQSLIGSFSVPLAAALRPVVLRQLGAALALVTITVLITTFLLSRRQATDEEVAVRTPVAGSSPSPSPTEPARSVTNPTDEVVTAPAAPRVVASSAQPRTKPLTEEEMLRQQVARTEREYISTIRMLDRAIDRRKESIDASAYAQYESSLALIDESIDKSRAALRGRAGDPVAGQFLLAAYARKVELMQEIALQ